MGMRSVVRETLEETTEMEIRLDIQSVACELKMEMLSIGAYILPVYNSGEMLRCLVGVLKQSSS